MRTLVSHVLHARRDKDDKYPGKDKDEPKHGDNGDKDKGKGNGDMGDRCDPKTFCVSARRLHAYAAYAQLATHAGCAALYVCGPCMCHVSIMHSCMSMHRVLGCFVIVQLVFRAAMHLISVHGVWLAHGTSLVQEARLRPWTWCGELCTCGLHVPAETQDWLIRASLW